MNTRKPLLAFSFETWDDGVEVTFARSEIGARSLAARFLGHDLSEVTLVRRPEFDGYATKTGALLPDHAFFLEGWTVSCAWCEHRLHEGDMGDCEDADCGGHEAGGHVVEGQGAVYCSPRCYQEWKDNKELEKRLKDEAVALLNSRWPFVVTQGAFLGGAGRCDCWRKNPKNVVVNFQVPGGPLSDRSTPLRPHHNHYCTGCRHAYVSQGDYPAFAKARREHDNREELVRPDHVVDARKPG